MENYIDMKLDRQIIFNFASLRFSNHSFEIEIGRYKKKTLETRLCKIIIHVRMLPFVHVESAGLLSMIFLREKHREVKTD